MKKRTMAAAAAALSLFEITAAATAAAQENASNIWNGWFLGLNGGFRIGDTTFESNPYSATMPPPVGGGLITFPARSNNFDLEGGTVGAHIQHNWLQGSNFLVGLRAEVSDGTGDDTVFLTNNLTSISGDAFAVTIRSEVDYGWQASFRGRIGYLLGNWLLFATGGVSLLKVDWQDTVSVQILPGGPTVSFNHETDNVNIGPVVGGGVETALNDLWFLSGEYLYQHFGDMTAGHGATSVGAPGQLRSVDTHQVIISVTRKIGGG
ncbi:MAG: outer membrane beta-barrel protein [Pseudomonadota bacterium]|nr:outer membrane beta-barrel protein [Pseudomonadota bacterium]